MAPRKLTGGPYRSPKCGVGEWLGCEIAGDQQVIGFTDAPVPWPYFHGPRSSRRLFICGDLALAIRTERGTAIAPLFGTSEMSISRWRRELGIEKLRGFARKVSDEQVATIRARAAAGETDESLAQEYGIALSYVWMLVENRRRASEWTSDGNWIAPID
jgi:hypothetical protein